MKAMRPSRVQWFRMPFPDESQLMISSAIIMPSTQYTPPEHPTSAPGAPVMAKVMAPKTTPSS